MPLPVGGCKEKLGFTRCFIFQACKLPGQAGISLKPIVDGSFKRFVYLMDSSVVGLFFFLSSGIFLAFRMSCVPGSDFGPAVLCPKKVGWLET